MSLLPFNTILVPTDFSDPARNALSSAVEIAEQFAAQLVLVHFMEPLPAIYTGTAGVLGSGPNSSSLPELDMSKLQVELLDVNRKRLHDIAVEMIPDNLVHTESVEFGYPGSEISGFSEKNNIDLIVISTHGMTGVTRFLMGSVTEKVVRTATVPVLVVRHSEAENE